MYWSKSELSNHICRIKQRYCYSIENGKRYINIDILENAIPIINTLKLKCFINEFIISLE